MLKPPVPPSTLHTPGRQHYSVAFSPFHINHLAVRVTSSVYHGLVGNGRLHLGLLGPGPSALPGLAFDKSYDTQVGLYDVAQSEVHENQLFTASGDGSIRLWDIMLKDLPIRAWQEHTREAFSVDSSNVQKDKVVFSSWDGTVKLWSPKRPHSLTTLHAHQMCVYQALSSPHQPDLIATCSTDGSVKPEHALFFTVIYLAPGDYHRFHSPTAWVVEKRRHFVGDLFSVSPWMVDKLADVFVLNERVALLGRWKYGFFGMVPVGATNVGSIKINFDQALRTNVATRHRPPVGTFEEAVYTSASPVLRGQPLSKAQEMGGFYLGSTIVLVFEAPQDFEFTVEAGQKIKMGEKLGDLHSNLTEKP
ncbi:hypothetical protein EVJ58_g3231 [Rhodofomes roseus]|uniref:phosphatidylserine decarboxylase n=1 Tax=Rhodofomes roseus TaxID=34475 RepID=A0A4Y9YMW8_9APHY|nr:hypothetical protein EVJ58_g3231 [Rhodofomes roseus]